MLVGIAHFFELYLAAMITFLDRQLYNIICIGVYLKFNKQQQPSVMEKEPFHERQSDRSYLCNAIGFMNMLYSLSIRLKLLYLSKKFSLKQCKGQKSQARLSWFLFPYITPFTGSSLHLPKFYLTLVSIFTPIKFSDYYARSLYLQYKKY